VLLLTEQGSAEHRLRIERSQLSGIRCSRMARQSRSSGSASRNAFAWSNNWPNWANLSASCELSFGSCLRRSASSCYQFRRLRPIAGLRVRGE
jgi:hypothetical protein